MPSVDNRLVEMRFDNRDFEDGVSESISSLDKLKQALKLNNVTDGFDQLGEAADAISRKFTVLGTIGDQIFRNLGNEIYGLKNQFIGLVKSLSIDQIISGWEKYATKTSSVQTIMAATADQFENEAEQMEAVNGQLDRLNWFTDETSYKLVDMVRNIGQFTSKGQSLDDSVTAMQGIATWAGISGANAEQATHAMNNLSQAMGMGYVRIQDWSSIETANMDTKEFKQTAIETAVALGTLKKTADGLYKTLDNKEEVNFTNFRTTLNKNWLTNDVLVETLQRYGGFTDALYAEMEKAEYKVTTSTMLEYIDAYANGSLNLAKASKETGIEASELAEDLKKLGSAEYDLGRRAFKASQEAKTFQEAIDATKDAVSSKWMQTFEIIFGDYDKARVLWTKLSNELWDIFAAGGDARNEMLQEWADEGGYDKVWDAVWNIWDGLKGIGQRIGDAWRRIFPQLDAQKLLDLTDKFYEFSVKFKERFEYVSDALEDFADDIETTVGRVYSIFGVGDVEAPIEETEDAISSLDEETKTYIKTLQDLDEVASDVWSGKYGVGEDRKKRLEEEGYSWELVQNKINETAGVAAKLELNEESLEKATKYLNGELNIVSETTPNASDALEELSNEAERARDWIDDLKDVIYGFKSGLDLIIELGRLAGKYLVIPAWNKLTDGFKKVLSIISPFSRVFSNFVASVKESGVLETYILAIKDWFKDLGNYLREQENFKKFIEYFDRFKEFLHGVKESALEKFTNFLDKIASGNLKLPKIEKIGSWIDKAIGFVNKILGIIDGGKNLLGNLDFSSIEGFAKSLATGLSSFVKALLGDSELINTILSWLRNLLNSIIGEASKIKIGKVIMAVLGFNAVRGASGLLSIPKALSDAIWGIWEALHGLRLKLTADALKDLAISIGILVASLYVLSKIPAHDLLNAVTALIAIMFAFGVLAKSMGAFDKVEKGMGKQGNKGITSILIGMGVAMLLVSVALKKIAKINSDDLWNAVAVIAVILAVMAAFAGVMKLISQISIGKNGSGSSMEFLLFAGYLAVLALAIDLILPAIATLTALSALKGNLLWKAIGALGSIMLLMAAFALTMKLISQISIKGSSAGSAISLIFIATSFVIMAAAIDLLIPAIVTLTGIAALGNNLLLKAIGGIAALMLAFSVMTLIARSVSSGVDMVLIAASFAIMAVAIDLLVPAILALSKAASTNLGTYIASILTIIVLLGSLVGALYLMSKIDASGMTKGIQAILAMAAAIAVIGGVLYMLKGSSFKELMSIVGAIAILAVVIVALGALVSKLDFIANGIVVLAVAMGAFGAAIFLVGLGALTFAAAIQMLSDASVNAKAAGKNLAEGVVAFFDELVANGKSILIFIGELISAIITVIAAKKANVVQIGADIFKAFGNKIVDMIKGSKGAIIIVLAVLLVAVMDFLGAQTDAVIDYVFLLIIKIINGITRAVITNAGHLFAAIGNLIAAIFNIVMQGISTMLQWIAGLLNEWFGLDTAWADDIAQFWQDESDKIVAAIDSENSVIDAKMTEDKNNITKNAEEIKFAYQEAAGTIKDGHNALEKAVLGATDKITVNGYEYSGEALSTLQQQILSGNVHLEMEEEGGTLGENWIGGFLNSVNGSSGETSDAINNWTGLVYSETQNGLGENSPSKYTEDMGKYWDEGLAIGIAKNVNMIKPSLKKLSDTAIDELRNLTERMRELGKNAVQGFANGIEAYLYLVKEKGRLLGMTARNATAEAIDSNSPAKEFELLGKYSDQGYAGGIEKNLYMITDAADVLGEEALAAFNSVIQRIQDAIAGDFDMSPVIRPVLDLSEIQNGQMRLGSMLGTNYAFAPNLLNTMGQAANITAATGNVSVRNAQIDASMIEMKAQLADMQAQNRTLTALLNRYLPYIPEVANMQIVTDRGALVGELAPMMDEKLGKILAKKRR